jgi:S1-C subfamily serine protease
MSNGIWNSLSRSMSEAIEAVQDSIVTVHGRGSTSSGVVWRPGFIVTVRNGLRRNELVKVTHRGEPFSAKVAGSDAGTDLAVFRVEFNGLTPANSSGLESTRVGELVLSVGRSGLGDISASSGIIARLGSPWRTWHGGQIDRLIRPDVRLYVGQSGSALVNEHHRVLGINSSALARNAIITVPTQTIDRVVDAILERGHLPRPFLGVAMQAVPIPEALRARFAEGADQILLVLHVEPNAPAASAGVMVGDLIASLNGYPVNDVRDALHRIAGLSVGDSISLAVIRGGTRMELTSTVADRG